MGQMAGGEGANQGSGEAGGGGGGSPWQKLLMGGLKGGLSGFSNMQNQNQQMRQGGGGGMMPMPAAQPVSADYFTPQQNNQNLIKRAGGMNNLNFYGGS